MEGYAMRRILASAAVLGLLVAAVAAAPVSAGTRTPVTMTVTTSFGSDANPFTATGLGDDCSWGWVYEGGANVKFPPPHGIFAGYKVFDCEGGGVNGFVVRLNARFFYDGSGSIGAWAVVASWGSLAGLSGAGGLTGEAIDQNSILDNYVGSVTL
jgi:hypothetical protein